MTLRLPSLPGGTACPPAASRPPRRQAFPTEHEEQVALVQWAAYWRSRLPDLARLYAIPNGGDRHPAVAGKLKAEGVRKGVPDLCLPVARGGYFGLYIELKAKGGRVTPEQAEEVEALNKDGHLAVVCVGMDEAVQVIEWYLAKKPTRPSGPRLLPPFKRGV